MRKSWPTWRGGNPCISISFYEFTRCSSYIFSWYHHCCWWNPNLFMRFLQLGDFPLPGGVLGSHGSVLLERGRGFWRRRPSGAKRARAFWAKRRQPTGWGHGTGMVVGWKWWRCLAGMKSSKYLWFLMVFGGMIKGGIQASTWKKIWYIYIIIYISWNIPWTNGMKTDADPGSRSLVKSTGPYFDRRLSSWLNPQHIRSHTLQVEFVANIYIYLSIYQINFHYNLELFHIFQFSGIAVMILLHSWCVAIDMAEAFQACCSGRRRLVLKGPLKDGHPGEATSGHVALLNWLYEKWWFNMV